MNLAPHRLELVLVSPRIAPNTGNIGRLCVATGTRLHLVRPLGFVINDKQLRRSAMDYWEKLNLTLHDDLAAFLQAADGHRLRLFSSKGSIALWNADLSDGDWLVFGNETAGLPAELMTRYADSTIRIPQSACERCLNLSTAAGIGLYEALRRLHSPS